VAAQLQDDTHFDALGEQQARGRMAQVVEAKGCGRSVVSRIRLKSTTTERGSRGVSMVVGKISRYPASVNQRKAFLEAGGRGEREARSR
jgi:hypothetical protein